MTADPSSTTEAVPSAADWLEARQASDGAQRPRFASLRSEHDGVPPAQPEDVTDLSSLPMFADSWVQQDGTTGRAPTPSWPRSVEPTEAGGRSDLDLAGLEADAGWELVAQYRSEVSSRLTARLEKEGGRITDETREQLGVEIIEELIKSEAESLVSTGRQPWSSRQEKALKGVLFDALFGLGRLQPLVDSDDVENIIILARGNDCSVWLEKTDGTVVAGPPVADSEDELREFLADLGARQNRPFTEARPSLHLRLPGGSRLAAASWVTASTSVVIRRHRLIEVSLDDMVRRRNACGPVLADFLAACVRAGKSIVVSGIQGSGKTTWVRALCSCIPPWEMIGTFETEFELHLHELPERHHIVHAWEHRPGSGEVGIDGRQAGQFTLEEAIHDSFRFILARQIVGEVRGAEVWDMLKAMESGPGSISTTHARSADHTIEKLVSCAMEMGPHVTRELAISKLAAAIDIVMYLRAEVVTNGDGTLRKQRWVEEVLLVEPSPDATKGYATTAVFRPSADGYAVASGDLSDRLRDELVRHGFDLSAYRDEADAFRSELAT